MATVILPLLTDLGATPHYTFECELEGQTYSFEATWNDRDGCWYLQLGDSSQNPLTGFQRVVLGTFLFANYTGQPNLPPGQFQAIDTTGQDQDAGLADLGSRVQIWYWESGTLAAL
jgi:hypothetical protein